MTISKQLLAAYLIAAALVGWYVAGIADTKPDNPRPGVRLIQRVIRWAGFLMFLADEPPAAALHAHPHDPADEHAEPMGSDGYPLVDHRGAL